jgi:HSP20 family molecular chaperone IbpA
MGKNYFNDMTSLFDSIFDSPLSSSSLVKTNVEYKDNKYFISISVPGLTKENIDIDIIDNTLIVKGINIENSPFINVLNKSYILPNDINIKKIKAKLNNGILEIILGKKEENLKKIEIE